MNLFCIVGCIEELPSLKETATGVKTCSVMMKVDRPFANSEGIYEQDLIQVGVWRGLAETLCARTHVGDCLAIKGRIASRRYDKEDKTYYNYAFVAEKIDFLSKKLGTNER